MTDHKFDITLESLMAIYPEQDEYQKEIQYNLGIGGIRVQCTEIQNSILYLENNQPKLVN